DRWKRSTAAKCRACQPRCCLLCWAGSRRRVRPERTTEVRPLPVEAPRFPEPSLPGRVGAARRKYSSRGSELGDCSNSSIAIAHTAGLRTSGVRWERGHAVEGFLDEPAKL